jgi:hypothetical protein
MCVCEQVAGANFEEEIGSSYEEKAQARDTGVYVCDARVV